jgi:hypothetical protein
MHWQALHAACPQQLQRFMCCIKRRRCFDAVRDMPVSHVASAEGWLFDTTAAADRTA